MTFSNTLVILLQDLAALVDGQQEQIDRIAETMDYSKGNTRAGLEEIQKSTWGLCGSHAASTSKQTSAGDSRGGEEFKWSMHFETIGDDMRRLGRNLMVDLQENVQISLIENAGGCGPVNCGHVGFDCQDLDPDRTFDNSRVVQFSRDVRVS